MKQIGWIVILIIGIGCQRSEPFEISSILGKYDDAGDSDDYNHLVLRADKTYHFDQARMQSCDLWSHWYGEWAIEADKLMLYQGIDLDTLINITSKTNLEADTLLILFEEAFMQTFPNLKVRIGFDTMDTEVVNNKIHFDKKAYCIKNELFEKSDRKDRDTYKYYPLRLNIRSNNFYKVEYYILDNEEIHFGLGNFKKSEIEQKKLVEYRKVKGILKSKSYVDWLNNHQLKKRNNKVF